MPLVSSLGDSLAKQVLLATVLFRTIDLVGGSVQTTAKVVSIEPVEVVLVTVTSI